MKDLLDSLQISRDRLSPTRRPTFAARWRRAARLAGAALILPLAAGAWYRFVLADPRPVEVSTAVVAGGAQPSTPALTAGGYIKDPHVVYVAPRVAGRISTLAVAEGDQVRAGDLVAVIDDRDFQQDVLEALADVEAAEAGLQKLQAGSRREDIAAARARVQAAEAAAQRAARELARTGALLDAGAVSPQAFDHAQAESHVQAGNLAVVREALAAVEAGPRPEDIAAAQAGLAAARARWRGAANRLADTRVVAPVAGRVLRKFRSAGDVVSPDVAYVEGAETVSVGSPVVSLAEAGPQEASADINETDIARIALHQAVEVAPNAFPGEVIRGTVTRISPRADRNKNTVEVNVTLEQGARTLPHDLSVKLTFLAPLSSPGERGGLAIPEGALVTRDGRSWVFVADGSRATLRRVEPGARHGGVVDIVRGLAGGERVIVGDLAALADGSPITTR